jgi:hypothetical protein
VAEFLSDDWFAMLADVDAGTDPSLTFVLDQIVTGAPGGDVAYRVTLEGGRLHVTRTPGADTSDPHATLRLSHATAVALATGATTATEAFHAGHVRFVGDLRRVQALTTAFDALGAPLARAGNVTTYPSPVPTP